MAHTSAHVAHTLAAHIDEVFGLMGNGNAYFLDALLRDTSATYTAVRHEAGAVVAADAHFRTSGRIAAATTTYGAGFTNTLTALAEAAQARVPLVLVVGDEPTSGPRPWDVDQIAMASAVGVRTYTVGRVDAAAATVTAIEHALTYRVPVVLAIPYDVATLDIGDIPAVPGPGRPTPMAPTGEFAHAALDRLATDLAGAERPLLLAGRGAWLAGAETELGELVDITGALTVTTALGRNIFPASEHDLESPAGSVPRPRWNASAKPMWQWSSAPRSTSSRCVSASSSIPRLRCGRSTPMNARRMLESAGSSEPTRNLPPLSLWNG